MLAGARWVWIKSELARQICSNDFCDIVLRSMNTLAGDSMVFGSAGRWGFEHKPSETRSWYCPWYG